MLLILAISILQVNIFVCGKRNNAELYNRDRDLFTKYIPLLQSINKCGWEPVTFIRTSPTGVIVERWGGNAQCDSVMLTVRLGEDVAAGKAT